MAARGPEEGGEEHQAVHEEEEEVPPDGAEWKGGWSRPRGTLCTGQGALLGPAGSGWARSGAEELQQTQAADEGVVAAAVALVAVQGQRWGVGHAAAAPARAAAAAAVRQGSAWLPFLDHQWTTNVSFIRDSQSKKSLASHFCLCESCFF